MNRYIADRNQLLERTGDELKVIVTFQFQDDCESIAKSMNEKFSRKQESQTQECRELQFAGA